MALINQQSEEPLLKTFDNHDEDIPFASDDYLQLVDRIGRAIVGENKGFVPDDSPDILQRMGLDSDIWLDEIK